MTIVEFLLARIAEDEEVASNRHETYCGWCLHEGPGFDDDGCQCNYPARVLAECAAKRQIVDYRQEAERVLSHVPEWPLGEARLSAFDATLRALALPYADHPDYQDEWRP